MLAQKERIVTFNLNDPKPQILPIDGLQNVIAVEFDMQDNCLFFADIVSDVISVIIAKIDKLVNVFQINL